MNIRVYQTMIVDKNYFPCKLPTVARERVLGGAVSKIWIFKNIFSLKSRKSLNRNHVCLYKYTRTNNKTQQDSSGPKKWSNRSLFFIIGKSTNILQVLLRHLGYIETLGTQISMGFRHVLDKIKKQSYRK